ncbi:SHOCT domain-containing protein [Paludibacter sp.]|uniref:SHOCT domain-containing protein n=1 Tax=Paludibacter sp. TaxID=1898105 RepID=UPI0013553546|nr:SHOCT domain-containing protein [Paludibacter sp.]MTK54594.1 SHOCT domain-containing protein [Paludibacter sp.]
MKLNTKVKPSKASSLMGAIAGLCFTIFGIVFFVTVSQESGFDDGGPVITLFFIIFILFALGITTFSLVNFFSNKGLSVMDVDINNEDMADKTTTQQNGDIESRLAQLEDLKNKKLITDIEYQSKRAEILNEL